MSKCLIAYSSVAIILAAAVAAGLHVRQESERLSNVKRGPPKDNVYFPGRKFHEQWTTSTASLPTLEGALKIGHGVNALTGQSGLEPIIDFTYTQNQTYTDPNTGIVYKVPDQTFLAPQSTTRSLKAEKLSESYSDVFNAYSSGFSFGAGIDVGSFGLSFKYSRELSKTKEEIESHDNYYGYSSYYTDVYSLDMGPAFILPLNFQFKQALSFLPSTIKTQEANTYYNDFVTSYGTHYPTLADFGGLARTISFLNKNYSHTHSSSDIVTQMGITFNYEMFKLNFGHNSNRSQFKIAKWFKEAAQTYNFWKGGNVAYQHNTTQEQWLKSLTATPGMVNTTLFPMDRLEIGDQQKAETLSAYAKEYIKSQGNCSGFRYP